MPASFCTKSAAIAAKAASTTSMAGRQSRSTSSFSRALQRIFNGTITAPAHAIPR
jgi:hypothetical protein